MKQVLKQIGKALCYTLLYAGMQGVIANIFVIIYSARMGYESAVHGTEPDLAAIEEGSLVYVMEKLTLIALISGVLTLLALWLIFLIRKKKFREEVGLFAFSPKLAPAALLLGVSFSVCISFGLCCIPQKLLEAYNSQSQNVVNDSVLLTILATVIVAPVAEEIVFRGLVRSRLKAAMPDVAAVLITSLIFALLHGQIIWSCYTFLLGILLCIVAGKSGSVGAGIFMHMAFNATGVFLPVLFSEEFPIGVNLSVAVAAGIVTVGILAVFLRLTKGKINEAGKVEEKVSTEA